MLVRFAEVLKRVESELGRYLVTDIELDISAREGRGGTGGTLSFDIVLRDAGQFRAKDDILQRALERETSNPRSPFKEVNTAKKRYDNFTDGGGGSVVSYEIILNHNFEPFNGEDQ